LSARRSSRQKVAAKAQGFESPRLREPRIRGNAFAAADLVQLKASAKIIPASVKTSPAASIGTRLLPE
jgi:hypothetical protein